MNERYVINYLVKQQLLLIEMLEEMAGNYDIKPIYSDKYIKAMRDVSKQIEAEVNRTYGEEYEIEVNY